MGKFASGDRRLGGGCGAGRGRLADPGAEGVGYAGAVGASGAGAGGVFGGDRGIALILARARLPVVFAAAVAIVLGLAWLTWPIWLSTNLVNGGLSGAVQKLVKVSPPLTINGILTNEPAWTERSLAYHFTDLNQDVPIQLPANAGACAALHGSLGFVLWLAAMVRWRESAPRPF